MKVKGKLGKEGKENSERGGGKGKGVPYTLKNGKRRGKGKEEGKTGPSDLQKVPIRRGSPEFLK